MAIDSQPPLQRLFGYARPYRSRMYWAVVGMVVYGIGSAGLPILIKVTINDVLPDQRYLAFTASAVIVLFLLKGIGSYVSSYLMADVGQRTVMDVRNRLFRHILGQSASFFAHGATGKLLSRINNDVAQVQQVVSETAADLARETLSLVGYGAVLVYNDARLTLVCFTSAPLIVYPLVRLGQRVRRTTRRSQEALENLSHLGTEAFTGHRIVKAFGTEDVEAEKFNRASYSLFRTNMKVTAALSALPPMMELIGGVGMAVALWYGSRQIALGRLTVGDFGMFVATLLLMYAPAKKLSRVNANVQQAIAAAERIFEMLDTASEVVERPNAPALAPFRDRIEFRDVSFKYDDSNTRILRSLSLTVRAGQMIAIVGRSGAGKTTLVNLLPRFYDVTGGAILVDGVDIRDVSLRSLRGQIGIVTQDTVLFDDSVARNIAYGTTGASAAEIEAAARAANAHDFIAALDGGYDAMIGERGQRLSGGQRQRIAIARALLKNAPILVLDEATSALDTESELLVQEALTNLMMNRTSFVIAHRLSTIRRADAIVVLERGRIVEVGRHDELLARPEGVYAALYQLQLLEGRKAERRMVPS
ncbi:MAG TPA: ABC transporter transmembrane domain-containing protein [Vicinamibacterales bacterium]|nr:ABC transporter transmembrane domain-containing protein [Vicinamibacterales bacterium]